MEIHYWSEGYIAAMKEYATTNVKKHAGYPHYMAGYTAGSTHQSPQPPAHLNNAETYFWHNGFSFALDEYDAALNEAADRQEALLAQRDRRERAAGPTHASAQGTHLRDRVDVAFIGAVCGLAAIVGTIIACLS